MVKVVISDSKNSFLNKLEKILTKDENIQVVSNSARMDQVNDLSRRHQPDVIILGPSYEVNESIEFAKGFFFNNPTVGLILVTWSLSPELLVQSLRAGFKELIALDEIDNLPNLVHRIFEMDNRLRDAILGGNGHKKEKTVTAPVKSSKVVTIFSTKGGVGKTFVASNLAVGLAKLTQKRVILVDLDLSCGDVGVMLNLQPKRTIFDILSVIDRLDAEMLQGFLTTHSSGADILLAPVQPDEAQKIGVAHLEKILALLRDIADYVIVDTPPSLNDIVLAALDESDEIYLVATMDVPSIKNVKVSLQTMQLLGYKEEKIRLILNRSDSKVSLELREIEKNLDKKITVFTPSDRLAPQSINEGVPIIISSPKANISRSLNQLVDLVSASLPYRGKVLMEEEENVYR